MDDKLSVSAFRNHRQLMIGPSNVSKTFYMLKMLDKKGNKRPLHIKTRSPKKYPNCETDAKIESIDKYRGSVIIFDHMLGA